MRSLAIVLHRGKVEVLYRFYELLVLRAIGIACVDFRLRSNGTGDTTQNHRPTLSFCTVPTSTKMNIRSPQKRQKVSHLLQQFESARRNTSESVISFDFNKNRVRLLKAEKNVKKKCKGILYWMIRDVRVQDNWALLFAQRTALRNGLPLHVCYCVPPTYLHSTLRHYKFLIKGLMEVEEECTKLNIKFHLLHGDPDATVLDFVREYDMGAVVADFSPLRLPTSWVNTLATNLPQRVPMCQVDAHNIVPCWHASPKQEYMARTFRLKIHAILDSFLTQFPPVIHHVCSSDQEFHENDWSDIWNHVNVDRSVDEIVWAKPGYRAAVKEFETFLNEHLERYATDRNNPVLNCASNLSPWFNFGMISIQRCVLEVNKYKNQYAESVESFNEHAIVRRELSDNYCFYNNKYDSMDGANAWAITTLIAHSKDKRKYLYKLRQLENAETHDDLWNACQIQLVYHGKMHGYLRMYWAKQILEYTETPQEALALAVYLNDRYSIDGNDPNGYVGCMWSICGLHDQGWKEREIFGKIRYMNYKGCKRKFRVNEFIAKWKKPAVKNEC